jgi:hypothetical protein
LSLNFVLINSGFPYVVLRIQRIWRGSGVAVLWIQIIVKVRIRLWRYFLEPSCLTLNFVCPQKVAFTPED